MLQVLRMLRGCTQPGQGFALHSASNSYRVAGEVHVEHLSLGSLHRLLGRFARCGTDMHR